MTVPVLDCALTPTALTGIGRVSSFVPLHGMVGDYLVSTVRLVDGRYETQITQAGQVLPHGGEFVVGDEATARHLHQQLVGLLGVLTPRLAYLVLQEDGAVRDVESGWLTHHDAERQAETLTREHPRYPASVLPVPLQGGGR